MDVVKEERTRPGGPRQTWKDLNFLKKENTGPVKLKHDERGNYSHDFQKRIKKFGYYDNNVHCFMAYLRTSVSNFGHFCIFNVFEILAKFWDILASKKFFDLYATRTSKKRVSQS